MFVSLKVSMAEPEIFGLAPRRAWSDDLEVTQSLRCSLRMLSYSMTFPPLYSNHFAIKRPQRPFSVPPHPLSSQKFRMW